MASTPAYASTPRVASANLTSALGGTRQTPTGATSLITAAASGTVINRAVIINSGSGDPADNVVAFYLYNGTTFYLYTEVDLGDQAAPTTALAAPTVTVPFSDLVLPTGWFLYVGIRVRASGVDDTTVTVFGGDL